MVPLVPASTSGFAMMSNIILSELLGQTPFVDEAVKVRVTKLILQLAI